MKRGKGEKVSDRLRELILVDWMGVSEITSAELLICNNLHFR